MGKNLFFRNLNIFWIRSINILYFNAEIKKFVTYSYQLYIEYAIIWQHTAYVRVNNQNCNPLG